MKEPILVHTEDDYEQAQRRIEELNGEPESDEKEAELAALAEAMLAYEMRRGAAEE